MSESWWRRGVAATAVLVCASVVAGRGVSTADTAAFTDRRGDAPRSMDVRQVTVSNEQRITVTTKLGDLRRRSSEGISVYIDTRRGDYGPEFAAIGGLGANNAWLMLRVERWDYRRGKILFDCDIELRVSYPRDTATFDIARRCLSGPERIRAAVSLSGYDYAPTDKTFYPSVGR